MSMPRSQCYDILFRLKKERNLDIDAAIETLAENDTVPESVIKFIEDNSTRTFRDFMLVISKSKPFYGNIVFNYTDNIEKYIKAMLSFLIHIKITLVKNPNLIQEFNEHFNIKEITTAINNNLTKGDNDEEVIKCAKNIKSAYLAWEEEEM